MNISDNMSIVAESSLIELTETADVDRWILPNSRFRYCHPRLTRDNFHCEPLGSSPMRAGIVMVKRRMMLKQVLIGIKELQWQVPTYTETQFLFEKFLMPTSGGYIYSLCGKVLPIDRFQCIAFVARKGDTLFTNLSGLETSANVQDRFLIARF